MEVRLGYKQTDVGVIPQHWDLQDFGHLYAEPSRNGIYKTQEYQGRGTRIVKMGEMSIAAILIDMDNEIVAVQEKLFKARHIKQGMMQELLTGRIRLI